MLIHLPEVTPLQILLDDRATPPTEILLFRFGTLPTLKGTFCFTLRSAALIMARWALLGREIGFDYEHGFFLDKSGAERIAAGWGKLELRLSGLWVTHIQWTPAATAKIAAKEFRYLSPALLQDKNGEIVGLQNIALTNNPATLAPTPLVLSAAHLLDMDDTQKTKHAALAQGLMRHCSALLAASQAAAGSDHQALKDVGAQLATILAPTASAIQQAFPGLEIEAEPQKMSAADQEEATAIVAAAKQITGVQDGVVGALLALQAKAQMAGQAQGATKEAFVDRMIKVTRQVHPQDRQRFLLLSEADLRAYAKSAPRIGPQLVEEVHGSLQLSGQPDSAAQAAAEKALDDEARDLLGLKEVK